tara:strand:+ start:858 stop:1178 length:321 start_codon:yes stop_codon:yes gene_type:complete
MKLELLKSRVLNSFIEGCGNNLKYEINAAQLIRLLKEKNLVLSKTSEKRELGLAVIDEIPNLIVGLSRARTQLISVEGHCLNNVECFIKDIENHLPYLRQTKALSA